jgi:hypothetical protein
MKVRTIREYEDDKSKVVAVGTVIERPDAYWLIGLEHAVAIDDEARQWQATFESQRKRRMSAVEFAAKQAQAQYLADVQAAEKERQAEFESILLEGT